MRKTVDIGELGGGGYEIGIATYVVNFEGGVEELFNIIELHCMVNEPNQTE